jgi:hypothetical protein
MYGFMPAAVPCKRFAAIPEQIGRLRLECASK